MQPHLLIWLRKVPLASIARSPSRNIDLHHLLTLLQVWLQVTHQSNEVQARVRMLCSRIITCWKARPFCRSSDLALSHLRPRLVLKGLFKVCELHAAWKHPVSAFGSWFLVCRISDRLCTQQNRICFGCYKTSFTILFSGRTCCLGKQKLLHGPMRGA